MKKLSLASILLFSIGAFAQRQVIVRTIINNEDFFTDQYQVGFELNFTGSENYYYGNIPNGNPGIMDEEVIEVPDVFTISSFLDFDDCPEDGVVWIRDVTPENFHTDAGFITGACDINGYSYPFYIEPFYLGPDPEMDSTFCEKEPIPLRSAREWKYQLVNEGNTWYNFGSNPDALVPMDPNLIEVHNFTFEQISNNYGYTGPIRIRGSYKGVSSNTIQLEIIPCSPELIEPIETFGTQCSDSEDGSFVAQFDRALIQDEELEIQEELQITLYLVNENENEEDYAFPTEVTSILDENNSYEWPVGLVPGNYYLEYQTVGGDYPGSLVQSDPFEIAPPDPVTFSLQHLNDVYCHSGSDGRIEIEAFGGTGADYQYRINNQGDWEDFNNGNIHILDDLVANEYEIEVRDGNECEGTSEDNSETIIEPSESVSANMFDLEEPTAYGFTDGSIIVDVKGGTPDQNNSYDYTWYDENNNPINTTSAQYINNVYRITLEDITAGTYTLAVKDANYNQADDKGGCELTQDFELPGPPELQLTMEETIPISCNSANNYNNPSNDGQLTANASGGVPPYEYFWSKKDENDDWQAIPNNNSEVLSNLEAGQYAVNIEDANGIVIGTYENNVLQEATPVEYLLEEPELLTVQIEKTDINCFGGTDGTATAIVSGGTSPFIYEWSSGADTETAEGLWLGDHSVYVIDARGCEAEAEVTIGQPDEAVSISNPQYVQPTANGFTDGRYLLCLCDGFL